MKNTNLEMKELFYTAISKDRIDIHYKKRRTDFTLDAQLTMKSSSAPFEE